MPADPQSTEPAAVLPPDIREEVTQALRMWARKKFGKWITWKTAWAAGREICEPAAKALLTQRQAREAAERERDEAQAMFDECAIARDASGFLGTVRECIQHWCNEATRADVAEASLVKAKARIAELEAAFLDIAHFTPDAATGVDRFEQITRHARATTLALLSSINKEPSHGL